MRLEQESVLVSARSHQIKSEQSEKVAQLKSEERQLKKEIERLKKLNAEAKQKLQ